MIAVCYTVYFAIGGLMIIGRLFPEKRTGLSGSHGTFL